MKVGIIGGSGYVGGELLRLLANRPDVEIVTVTSRTFKNQPVNVIHAHLLKTLDLYFEDIPSKEVAKRSDVVFTAVPHKAAMTQVPELLTNGAKVIDLSADYRLKPNIYEKIYGTSHSDRERKATYGLPELHRADIRHSDLVANPGCFPTGAILAAAPLVKAGIVERIVFDSKTGISGAGMNPSEVTHYPNVAENILPYNVTTHRHNPEIEQELALLGRCKVHFTPHIIPAVRGILTTAHIFVKKAVSKKDVMDLYWKMYADEVFVRIVEGVPSLGAVRGSNFCDIGCFDVEGDRIVVISAIDNMVKGASGQAIQNMNIMFGLDEKAGLWMPGIAP
ncbi:MAG: N-acetyl-gamma-glutamyl-phosphate reductase [Methanosarcinales archaeon Met12]|nr:MAG: N-acetyl-gamma-glutamyl-phosphate reductase [Methanosarcinales archaeon Met12]